MQSTSAVNVPIPPPPQSPFYRGIDVSEYQPNIDWKKVAADPQASISFAIIKCSSKRVQELFVQQWTQAKAAGLTTAAYHYLYGGEDIKAQVQRAKEQLGVVDFSSSDWLFVDVEETGNKGLSKAHMSNALVDFIKGMCDDVDGAPQLCSSNRIGIYTSPSYWKEHIDGQYVDASLHGRLTSGSIPLWVADWRNGRSEPEVPPPWSDWTIWQYTSRGCVDGIDCTRGLDMDYAKQLPLAAASQY